VDTVLVQFVVERPEKPELEQQTETSFRTSLQPDKGFRDGHLAMSQVEVSQALLMEQILLNQKAFAVGHLPIRDSPFAQLTFVSHSFLLSVFR
jgi:hypothetical protein